MRERGIPYAEARTRQSQVIVAAAAIIAGAAWVAKGIGSHVASGDYWDCNSASDYAWNGIDTIAFLAVAFTILGLCNLFADAIDSKRAVVGVAGGICFGVAGIANLLEHCAGLDKLGFAYVIGLMLGMVLLFLFSLALRRAPIPTWPAGLLLVGTAAGTLLANQGGLVAFGCSWMLLGLVLVRPLLAQAR